MRRLSSVFTLASVAAVLVTLVAPPVLASEPDPQLGAFSRVVIPTSANVTGQFGAVYRTRVTIFNVTNQTFTVEVIIYGGGGQVAVGSIQLGPGQIRNYENFLDDLFHYSGAAAIVFNSFASGRDFIVKAEVYTQSPAPAIRDLTCGTPACQAACDRLLRFTTVVTGGTILENILPEQDAYSLGITVDSNNRTNIGVFNDAVTAQTVTAEIYNASGSLVKTISQTVNGKTWAQVGVSDITVAGGFIKWKVQASAYLWAVTVSNDTNDGTFVYAADVLP